MTPPHLVVLLAPKVIRVIAFPPLSPSVMVCLKVPSYVFLFTSTPVSLATLQLQPEDATSMGPVRPHSELHVYPPAIPLRSRCPRLATS